MTPFPPIETLLPHAPPMVLLDKVIAYEKTKITTALTPNAQSPFHAEKGIPSYVGLEYMAQSCGVYAGLEALAHNQPPRLGFLLGTRNFHATQSHFTTGDTLHIHATEIFRQDGMGVFDCRIVCNNQEIATAQLNLYQPDEQG